MLSDPRKEECPGRIIILEILTIKGILTVIESVNVLVMLTLPRDSVLGMMNDVGIYLDLMFSYLTLISKI